MISNESQRILIKANGAAPLVDVSDSLNDFRKDVTTFSLEASGYIYIGQYLPFNSRYLDITSPSVVSAALSVEYWTGSKWESMVDVRDRSSALNTSGYLTYRLDRDLTGWGCDDTNEMPDLSSAPVIYRFYWARVSTDTDLGSVDMNYLGNLFSSDDEMYSYYPALDNQITKDQWEPTSSPGTKTDWLEQGFMASEMIVRDLKTRDYILESGQILDTEIFNTPSIHLQASIIYAGLGRGFEDDRKAALTAYEKGISLARKHLDKCIDGKLTASDRVWRTGFAKR